MILIGYIRLSHPIRSRHRRIRSDQLANLIRWFCRSQDNIFSNKRPQVLTILIISSVLENCKEFESTFMSNPRENHSVHEGRSTLLIMKAVTLLSRWMLTSAIVWLFKRVNLSRLIGSQADWVSIGLIELILANVSRCSGEMRIKS